ncbi:MAG: helix-turn-helix domain-containing protein [Oscillospiraceae bacterium]|nr:helix-turn-helix domain-containing protein [Oscillospiraceae bacterium]
MRTAVQKNIGFDDLSDFFTLSELASVIGISKATAYRMADQGRIPCIRLGKRIILSKNHLRQWIDKEIGFGIDSENREEIENA